MRDRRLAPEQVAGVRHVLESTHRVTAIQGRAGVGKTTLMTETIEAIRARGWSVLVLAPAARTAHQVLRSEGFADADTVEQFLVNTRLQQAVKGGVIWIDEAGQLSTRTMYRVFEKAEELNARVVLSGDTRQHRGVERGDAFRVLQEFAELPVVTVETVRRQQGAYKAVVEDLSRGRVVDAVRKLHAMGAIQECDTPEQYRKLANDYMAARRDNASVLAIAPTRAECRKVTRDIRIQLAAAGELRRPREVAHLREIDLTEAERADWHSYRPGWVIEMVKSAPGCRPGERYLIEGAGSDRDPTLSVRGENGNVMTLDVRHLANRFRVFESDTIELASGERIRLTKNAWVGIHRVYNGGIYEVESITEGGDVKLKGGIALPREFQRFDYGYASTSYSAQGQTVDRVLIAESSISLGAASLEQFYVSISRGRLFCRVYTDSIEALMEAVEASSRRLSALEMLKGCPAPDHEEELRFAQRRAERARTELQEPMSKQLGSQGLKHAEITRERHSPGTSPDWERRMVI